VIKNFINKCSLQEQTITEQVCTPDEAGNALCRDITRQDCNISVETNKKYTQKTSCDKVVREVCGPEVCPLVKGDRMCTEEVKTFVQEVPKESCDLVPQKVCNPVSRVVPGQEPKTHCIEVPKEICTNVRVNKEKVMRPMVKKWCGPKPESLTTTASTVLTYPYFPTPLAIDGDVRTFYHSALDELYPWFQVELTTMKLITGIRFTNRHNHGGDRFHDVGIHFSNTPMTVTGVLSAEPECAFFAGPSSTGQVHVIKCAQPMTGKYLLVQLRHRGTLQIAELELLFDHIDECDTTPCQNGGTCTNGVNYYTCACALGFTGGDCETNIDECAETPCQNGGTCTDGVNFHMCACALGFTGGDCETSLTTTEFIMF
jgi:hypothetical protein